MVYQETLLIACEYANPWESMDISTQRRIHFDTDRDFFWMTDLDGNYGLYFKADAAFAESNIRVRFKGMTILWRNSTEQIGEIFLVLHEKENWRMFFLLCQDLIWRTHRTQGRAKPSDVFESGLRDWQNLLSLS